MAEFADASAGHGDAVGGTGKRWRGSWVGRCDCGDGRRDSWIWSWDWDWGRTGRGVC